MFGELRRHERLIDRLEARVNARSRYTHTQREAECWVRNELRYVVDLVAFLPPRSDGVVPLVGYEEKTGRRGRSKALQQAERFFEWSDYHPFFSADYFVYVHSRDGVELWKKKDFFRANYFSY